MSDPSDNEDLIKFVIIYNNSSHEAGEAGKFSSETKRSRNTMVCFLLDSSYP